MPGVLTPEILGRTFAEAPDPELARVAFSRVGENAHAREVLGRAEVLPVASRLLGFSTAASDLMVRHPEEVDALTDVRARDRKTLEGELAHDCNVHGTGAGLRRFRRRAMLRIAARDLADAPFEEIVAEISDLADACLEKVCPDGMAAIALGKLGGRELNYASDVDLLLIHREDMGPDVVERAAARFSSNLSEPTTEGVALRVDLTLRPGGRAGALVRTLTATLAYYEREAATWERQAMIKARASAGDPALGDHFVQGVAEFVYPRDLHEAAIHDVRRSKVRLEEYVRRRGKELTEVKRGRGGIRDVEFAVQLLQIVHGRRDERLREPNTLRALAVLADEGYVAHEDAEALADAYRFLRRLEHRLQIVHDLQTHDLPADRHARTTLARSLGLAGADALQAEYDRTTELVRGIHERLFYRPLLEAFAGPVQPTPGHDREATEELLAGLGFTQPPRAFEALQRLVAPVTRIGKVLSHVFPVMAPALALAADPDAALVRLERIAEAVGDRAAPADALAADPQAARRLAHLAAASSFATDLLVADPDRILALSGSLFGAPAVDSQAQLVEAVARSAGRELTPRETGEAIAAVAYRVIEEAVAAAEPSLPFAVVGMGKLGAKELNVASDLDLVFVYEGEGPDDLARATSTAERVMRHVHEAGWEPDADLRPEGRSGPLARSMAGFLEYWERYADPWEFQSLLRARHVAGDRDLGRRFELNAADFAYPPDGLTLDRVVEVRRMRERIERERVRPPEASRFHFKLGRGSLADVQFAAELSLMRFGGADPAIRSRRTLEAIEKLAAARHLEDQVARDLAEAFVFLSEVKNALEMDRRVHAEAVPAAPGEQTALARRLGFEEYPRQAFLERYLHVTRRCRRAMERVFAQALG
jgi:glutamate-ammonia-ligase adenylyltransferase